MAGAASPSLMKAYLAGSQIMLPAAPLMGSLGRGAMKPLCARSNEVVSVNGSSLSNASLAALVASVACFGSSAAHAWVAIETAAARRNEALNFHILAVEAGMSRYIDNGAVVRMNKLLLAWCAVLFAETSSSHLSGWGFRWGMGSCSRVSCDND
ncbi:hypothetical protein D9M70_562440 [compost metagenome]